ncbi:unnamed protein product [Closterium sp. NIES-53]
MPRPRGLWRRRPQGRPREVYWRSSTSGEQTAQGEADVKVDDVGEGHRVLIWRQSSRRGEASYSMVEVAESTGSLAPEVGEDFKAVVAAVQANLLVVLLDIGCSHHLMGTKEVFVEMQLSGSVHLLCQREVGATYLPRQRLRRRRSLGRRAHRPAKAVPSGRQGWQPLLPPAQESQDLLCVGEAGRQEERHAARIREVADSREAADQKVGHDASL